MAALQKEIYKRMDQLDKEKGNTTNNHSILLDDLQSDEIQYINEIEES